MAPGAPPIAMCASDAPFDPGTTPTFSRRVDIPVPNGVAFGTVTAPFAVPRNHIFHAVDAAQPGCTSPRGAIAYDSVEVSVTGLFVLDGRVGNDIGVRLGTGIYDDGTAGPEPTSRPPGKVKLRITDDVAGFYPSSAPPLEEIGIGTGSTFTSLTTLFGSYKIAMIDPMDNGSFGARFDGTTDLQISATGFTMNAGESWSLYLIENGYPTLAFVACNDDAPPVGGLEQCQLHP